MEFQQVIETRRSIRHFDSAKTVDKDTILQLILAATEAPSWKNSQTARYYCLLSPDKLAQFKENCLPAFNAKNAEGASALIVSTFVSNRSGFDTEGTATNELGNGWGCYDLGLHNENLLLKASDLGLGTLVMGIRDAAQIRSMLSIPEEEIIVAVIAVGYPTGEAVRPKRKQPEDIVTFF